MKNSLTKECSFSIQLKSKVNLKSVSMTNASQENVLVEGTIGHFQSARLAEGIVLEVIGDKGILRVCITENEIKKLIERRK